MTSGATPSQDVLKRPAMQVPNWLIMLELSFGAALLYLSSSALFLDNMRIERENNSFYKQVRAIEKPAVPVQTSTTTIVSSSLN